MFLVAFSLAALPGPLSNRLELPSITPVKALQDNGPGAWYPAGPQMQALTLNTFVNEGSEFSALQAGQIDAMTDPLTASQQSICSSSTAIVCTQPVADRGYFDIEFNLAGVFWGIAQTYGNSGAGTQLRQGIAHLINKQSFTSNDAACLGVTCIPNDQGTAVCVVGNCTNGGLYSANPCSWDSLFAQSGSNCVVGASGGIAYNCAFSVSCPSGTATGSTTFPWQAAIGSPDFCAAAQHFVQAFAISGVSGVTTNANCELVPPTGGWTATVTSLPADCSGVPATADLCFFVRNDDSARRDLGEGLAQDICALFSPAWGAWTTLAGQPISCDNTNTGSSNAACGGGACPFLQVVQGTVSQFCGLDTSLTGTPNNCWGMYTGDHENLFTFETSLYHLDNSLFTTKTTVTCTNVNCSASTPGSTCASTKVSTGATDYQYVCNSTYDSLSNALTFALCIASPGPSTDPTPGAASPTFANCSGGLVSGGAGATSCIGASPGCSADSAGYQAEDYFGSHLFAIPLWSRIDVVARQSYLNLGDAPGYFNAGAWSNRYNFFEYLNGYSNAGPLTLQQGIANGATSANPFVANNFFDLTILYDLYDGLFMPNPECGVGCASAFQLIDWMTTSHALLCGPGGPACTATTLGYTPPLGTAAVLRLVLNRNMHWQDCSGTCPAVTAWDVKFSLINLQATSAFLAAVAGLSNLNGIQVLNMFTLDLNFAAFSNLSTEMDLNMATIVPGHVWSACGGGRWAANLAGASPTVGDNLSHDPVMEYVDSGLKGHWVSGDSIVMDYDGDGTYGGGDIVIYGPVPAFGTVLSADPLISFDNPSAPAFTRTSWTGQTVVYDTGGTGQYAAVDPVILQQSGSGGSNIAGSSIVAAPEDACIGTATGTCSIALGSPSALFNGCLGSMVPPSGSNPCSSGTLGCISFADPTFDPVTSGFLIGSGPWVCESTNAAFAPLGTVGTGCTSDNTQAPLSGLGTYTLTRSGCPVVAAGGNCSAPTTGSDYFRSSGNLALYDWTGDIGSGSADFSKLLTVNSCHSSTPSANCPHWAQGIGNPGGTGTNPVGLAQRLKVNAYKGVSWIGFSTDAVQSTQLILTCGAGYTLPGTTLTPCTVSNAGWTATVLPGIGTYASTLYEVGSALTGVPTSTLSPATPPGAGTGSYTNCAPPVGVATGKAYPSGGYDC